jgi:cell shape-determining protein MreD
LIRVIPFLLYLVLIAMHQVITRDLTTIYGMSINLAALIVIMVAIYKTEMTSLWFGLVAGLVMAAGLPAQMGWLALLMAVIGAISFNMRTRLNLDSIYSKLLLVFGGVLVFNIFSLIIFQYDDVLFLAVTHALGGAIYTTVVAWLFFLVKEHRLTVEKVRSIF